VVDPRDPPARLDPVHRVQPNLLAGTIIPASVGIDISEDYRLDIASNLYSVITEGSSAV
jgi:hypothetical protein